MTRPTHRWLLAGLAASALLLAGCGVERGAGSALGVVGDDVTVVSAAGLRLAGSQTAEVSTRRFAMTTELSAGPVAMSLVAEGALDSAANRGEVQVEVSGEALGSFGDGLTSVEMVYDGDTGYVKLPDALRADDAKPWASVTANELAGLGTSELGTDPTAILDLLQAGGEVGTLGTEEVRGVPTTHLAVELDVASIIEEADPDRAAQLRDQLNGAGMDLDAVDPVDAEVWVDEQDYVRRLRLVVDQSLGSLAMTSTLTLELYDFGEPVEIAVPDPSEVTEVDPVDLFGN